MKTTIITILAFALLAALCIIGSQHAPTLPSRPPTGNHGQGGSPGRDRCPPETIAIFVENLFLECAR